MSDSTYTTMTAEYLGQDATEEDLADFKAACRRVTGFQLDEAEATEYIWNNGRIRFNADICAYCESVTPDGTIVPAADDDELWALIAPEHDANCEWVATRAHRLAN